MLAPKDEVDRKLPGVGAVRGYTGSSDPVYPHSRFSANSRLGGVMRTFHASSKYGVAILFVLSSSLFAAAPGHLAARCRSDVAQTQPAQPNKGQTGAPSGSPAGSHRTKKNGRLHLQGVLVEGGAECQRFRASNNKFYTLTGDLREFRTGDRVEITGKIPQVSHCMQDTTIQVLTIRRAKSPGSSANHKPKSPGAPN